MSAALEGTAVHAAYREILSQSQKERVREKSKDGHAPKFQVLAYLREGRDVMSTATFTEAFLGVLGAGVGIMGLGFSLYLESGMPDVAASIIMASMVCGSSAFLLQKSGIALVGQTLPKWRVKALVLRLEKHV